MFCKYDPELPEDITNLHHVGTGPYGQFYDPDTAHARHYCVISHHVQTPGSLPTTVDSPAEESEVVASGKTGF